MKIDNKEYRNIKTELRATSEDEHAVPTTIEGYAIRFNEPSADMGYIEIIDKAAVSQELLDNSDVFCLFNHDPEKVLARCFNGEGSLHLELRDDGLYYSFDIPQTELGRETLEHIQRKEMFGSSFCFAVEDSDRDEEWTRTDDNQLVRTIKRIAWLGDVSPVFTPAYPTTNVSSRGYDKVKSLEEKYDGMLKELDERCDLEKIK